MSGSTFSPGEIVRKINQLWLNGHVKEIGQYLHPGIIIVHPGFSGRSEGAEMVLASFAEYVKSAATTAFSASDFQEDVFENTAVVSYRFETTYEIQGITYDGSGRDLWVFEKGGDGWKALWRTMSGVEETERPGTSHPE